MQVKIGTWHEVARQYTQHTSYAADHVEHEIIAGDYDAYVEFVGGYLIPMPYWLLVSVKSKVVGGGYFSGFGGLNFAFTPATLENSTIGIQLYNYQIPEAVKNGRLTLLPEYTWLNAPHKDVLQYVKDNITWDTLEAVKAS